MSLCFILLLMSLVLCTSHVSILEQTLDKSHQMVFLKTLASKKGIVVLQLKQKSVICLQVSPFFKRHISSFYSSWLYPTGLTHSSDWTFVFPFSQHLKSTQPSSSRLLQTHQSHCLRLSPLTNASHKWLVHYYMVSLLHQVLHYHHSISWLLIMKIPIGPLLFEKGTCSIHNPSSINNFLGYHWLSHSYFSLISFCLLLPIQKCDWSIWSSQMGTCHEFWNVGSWT